MNQHLNQPTSRREFLENTGRFAAASALAGLVLPHVHAAEDNTIRLALIGCGGRGSGAVANAMSAGGLVLGDDGGTRSVIETLIGEFYEVAAAEGVELVASTAGAYVERFFSDLLPPTREHRSSMQEDIENGRPTEISALNGAVCRMASDKGIEVPANRLLTTLVEFLERRSTEG